MADYIATQEAELVVWFADPAAGQPESHRYRDDGGRNRGAVWVLFLDGVPCDPGDMNCDGNIDALDIEPFLGLLFGGGIPCNICTGDANGDGNVDALDIEPFLNLLFPLSGAFVPGKHQGRAVRARISCQAGVDHGPWYCCLARW